MRVIDYDGEAGGYDASRGGEAAFVVESDVAEVTAPLQRAYAPRVADRRERVVTLAAGHGLRMVNEATFPGIGQGRSPRQWRERITGSSHCPDSRGSLFPCGVKTLRCVGGLAGEQSTQLLRAASRVSVMILVKSGVIGRRESRRR